MLINHHASQDLRSTLELAASAVKVQAAQSSLRSIYPLSHWCAELPSQHGFGLIGENMRIVFIVEGV